MFRTRALSAIALSLLAGCQAYPVPTGATAIDDVLLKGRVVSHNRLLSLSTDLVSQATVSLIDGSGVTRAAGTTDEDGDFVLHQSRTPFTPANGTAFTLQAMKRVQTETGPTWLSLRTVVMRQGGAWRSITGGDVVIDTTTTAIAKIEAADEALAPSGVMNKVSGATVSALAGHDVAEIKAYAQALDGVLAAGQDAGGTLVYHGDVDLSDQASVDALLAYEVIDGYLSITPDSEEVSISLPHLRRVTDYVSAGSSNLTSLAGLKSLARVGALDLGGGRLTSLRGLEKLTTIDHELDISPDYWLESLDGLEALTSCESLRISRALNLADISALGRLTQTGEIVIDGCQSLTSLHGLEGLTTVPGDVRIGRNVWVHLGGPESGLTSLAGLDNLETVGGELVVARNKDLIRYEGATPGVGGLRKLQSVGGAITFTENGTDVLGGGPGEAFSLNALKDLMGAN